MEPSSIEPLIDDLSTSLNHVDSILTRLTSPPESLIKYAQTLPLLDRAKLLTTTVYALESLLLNALKLSGTDVKQHQINTELQRLKQYFEKIKLAENPDAVKRPEGKGVDKAAVGRFVKAGLAGNERWDRERAAQIERERAGAADKLKQSEDRKFRGKKRKFDEKGQYLPEERVDERATELGGTGEQVEVTGDGNESGGGQEQKQRKQKHKKKKSSRPPKSSKEALEALLKGPILPPPAAETPDKERKKKRKKNKSNHGNGKIGQNT
jgi:exosome complex protein LRP1